jgi:hypothetical protein
VQALNKPTNTQTRTVFCVVRRMAMAVFLGVRLTLSDQDGFQCQVRYVLVGLRYFSMAKGAKEVHDSMGSCMEYAVLEYRVYSIAVVDFVFHFLFDDTKILFSTQITRHCCCEIMHTMQTNMQYHESTILCIWNRRRQIHQSIGLNGLWFRAPAHALGRCTRKIG